MTIQQNNNGTGDAKSPLMQNTVAESNRPAVSAGKSSHWIQRDIILSSDSDQKIQLFWIGVLARYLDIWCPSDSVKLEELGGQTYSFDFSNEDGSKLVKIVTMDDELVMKRYSSLPFADRISFIIDVNAPPCEFCGLSACGTCDKFCELARRFNAYICGRIGTRPMLMMKMQRKKGHVGPVQLD